MLNQIKVIRRHTLLKYKIILAEVHNKNVIIFA